MGRSLWLSEGWAKIHHRSIVLCAFFFVVILCGMRGRNGRGTVHKIKEGKEKKKRSWRKGRSEICGVVGLYILTHTEHGAMGEGERAVLGLFC